jgi:TolB-like protein/class 3 adenylate cyclase
VRDNEPVRKLTTILSADAAEFSRMMRSDEEGTFRILRSCRDAIQRLIGEHQGRVFSTAGDSVVAEFASPVEALRCSADIQQAIEKVGASQPENLRMKFRIGLNLGDVLVEGTDLIGDGVNVAARIQQAAKPGETWISASVHEVVKNQPEFSYDDLGGLNAKNLAEPIHVHRARRLATGGRPNRRRRMRAVLRAGGWSALVASLAASAIGLAAYLGYVPLPAWQSKPRVEDATLTHASIAVLPFENQTGDPEQEYFVDGITDDVTLALGRFSDLSVIASEAVQQYKGRFPKLSDLRADLGVGYVLDGSVSRSGDQVRVKVELSDAVTGKQLWPGQYEGDLKDVFAFQDSVTQNVVGVLAIKISDIERQRSLAKPPENLQAYDYLQRGREYFRRNTRADNREARKMFDAAIALDPDYASAYVARALSRTLNISAGWADPAIATSTLTEAEGDAHKALELDSSNALAHAALADIQLLRKKYEFALEEDNRAIDLNPNDAFSHAARGGVLVFSGPPAEAVKSFEIARRLNPTMDVVRQYPVNWAYYLVQRYDEAARISEVGARDSTDYFNPACLAAAYAQLGRRDDAGRAAKDTLRAFPLFDVETFVSQFQRETDQHLVREGLLKAGLK